MKKSFSVSLILFVMLFALVTIVYIVNKNNIRELWADTTKGLVGAKKIQASSSAESSSISTAVEIENPELRTDLVLMNQITVNAKIENLEEASDAAKAYLGTILLLSSGDIAYIVKANHKSSLFLNNEKLKEEGVSFVKEIAKNLVYLVTDFKNDQEFLFFGRNWVVVAPTGLFTISDVQEIDGDISYVFNSKNFQQKILFYKGKKIIEAPYIKNVKKTSGGFSYITSESRKIGDTLFYNDQKVLSAHEILSYLEVGDKLAYVTFGYLDKEHTPSEGFFASDYTTKETLFYDGKKIITDDSIEIYNISNKLAYVVSTKYGKKNLFYNNKKIVTADNITDIKPVGNKISYVISDYNADKKKLFVGDDLIVTKNNINYIDYINVKEINGKILYSVRDNLTEDIVTFYDSEMIGSNIDFMKIISSNIDNGLCYIIFDKTTLKNSLMCNKKIITENVSDFRVSDISSSTFFILKTEETASSTILSVYRLTL